MHIPRDLPDDWDEDDMGDYPERWLSKHFSK